MKYQEKQQRHQFVHCQIVKDGIFQQHHPHGLADASQTEQEQYQHENMLRQDYNGLFYRKLHTIIELQQLLQIQTQVENQIKSLSPAEGLDLSFFSQGEHQKTTPILLTTKEAAEYHSKIRKKVALVKKKGEMDVIISRLNIERKICLEEIKALANQWTEVVKQRFQNEECLKVEERLLQAAKKHNLSKVLLNFMEELRQMRVGCWLMQLLSIIGLDQQGLTELKLGFGRGKKEIVGNLTLYLKDYYSPIIFRQFTNLIANLTEAYESLSQIPIKCLSLLQAQLKALSSKENQLSSQLTSTLQSQMDLKIDIQILAAEQQKIQKRLWSNQKYLQSFVNKQAKILQKQYEHQKIMQNIEFNRSFLEQGKTDNQPYNYFHLQLSNRYKIYMVQYLKRAQQIQYLQLQLQNHNQLLSEYEKSIKESQSCASSLNSNREMERISEPAELYDSSQESQEEQEREREWNLPLQTYRATNQIFHSQHEKQPHLQFQQGNRSNEETPTLSGCKQNKENNPAEPHRKITTFFKNNQNKERFIVKKSLTIGLYKYDSKDHKEKEECREFEAKLTKKYLILQPLQPRGENTLSICQKIELQRIKNYHSNIQKGILKVNYGSCVLGLHFITRNIDTFCKKMIKIGLKLQSSQHLKEKR